MAAAGARSALTIRSASVGRKVVLATGVRTSYRTSLASQSSTMCMLTLRGFEELWGKSIAHCVFCDGQELCQGPTAHLAVV